ncbi:MAG: hypothetical protein V7785_11380 [Bermanella sp.]
MLKLCLFILSVFSLSGCSMLIERSAKYSEFALEDGHTREDIIAELGEPIKSNSSDKDCHCEVFLVEGRIFDTGDYWASNAGWIMTLGIHELLFFPMSVWEVASEGISPSEKELEICPHGDRWWLREVRDEHYLCNDYLLVTP